MEEFTSYLGGFIIINSIGKKGGEIEELLVNEVGTRGL